MGNILNNEEIARAHNEGWTVWNDTYLSPIFNSTGLRKFFGPDDVYEFFMQQIKNGSQWHRDIFLALPWSPYDALLAKQENWGISFTGEIIDIGEISPNQYYPTLSIGRVNEKTTAQVIKRAQEGDVLCIKAIKSITAYKLKEKH